MELYFIALIAALVLIIVVSGLIRGGAYVRFASYLALMGLTAYLYSINTIDAISLLLSMLALVIGLTSSMYTNIYERLKYSRADLHILIDLFALSTYTTFIAPALLMFAVCWFIASIIGFFAIIYEAKPETWRAGLRYLVVSTLPSDIAVLTLLACSYFAIGEFSEALLVPVKKLPEILGSMSIGASTIVMLGFSAKAAIAPLHFWLPDAHSLAPSPASAILSGVLVKMGVYGILRVLPAIDSAYVPYAFTAFATITAIYGGLIAIMQIDIKRILAYSTVENTGLIVLSLMLFKITKAIIFRYAALSLIIAHALFKSALFLNSGSVEIHAHTRDVSKLGHLAGVNPSLAFSALISVLSLIGVPPTMGFVAKLFLIMALIGYLATNIAGGIVLISAVSLSLALAIIYSIKYLTIYWGTWVQKEIMVLAEAKSLVKWEYPLVLLNITSPLLMLPLLTSLISLELTLALAFSIAFFILVLVYLKARMKTAVRDVNWLGGAIP